MTPKESMMDLAEYATHMDRSTELVSDMFDSEYTFPDELDTDVLADRHDEYYREMAGHFEDIVDTILSHEHGLGHLYRLTLLVSYEARCWISDAYLALTGVPFAAEESREAALELSRDEDTDQGYLEDDEENELMYTDEEYEYEYGYDYDEVVSDYDDYTAYEDYDEDSDYDDTLTLSETQEKLKGDCS